MSIIDKILAAPSDVAAYEIAFRNRGNTPAKSTLDAAEYLARLGDGKRLETWLLEHSPEQQVAIAAHLKARSGQKS